MSTRKKIETVDEVGTMLMEEEVSTTFFDKVFWFCCGACSMVIGFWLILAFSNML